MAKEKMCRNSLCRWKICRSWDDDESRFQFFIEHNLSDVLIKRRNYSASNLFRWSSVLCFIQLNFIDFSLTFQFKECRSKIHLFFTKKTKFTLDEFEQTRRKDFPSEIPFGNSVQTCPTIMSFIFTWSLHTNQWRTFVIVKKRKETNLLKCNKFKHSNATRENIKWTSFRRPFQTKTKTMSWIHLQY